MLNKIADRIYDGVQFLIRLYLLAVCVLVLSSCTNPFADKTRETANVSSGSPSTDEQIVPAPPQSEQPAVSAEQSLGFNIGNTTETPTTTTAQIQEEPKALVNPPVEVPRKRVAKPKPAPKQAEEVDEKIVSQDGIFQIQNQHEPEFSRGYLSDNVVANINLGYFTVKTENIEYKSELIPGLSLTLAQRWTETVRLKADISYAKLKFTEVADGQQTSGSLEVTSLQGSVGAEFTLSERTRFGVELGMGEDLSIFVDPNTSTVRLAKYARPYLGLSLSYTLWSGSVGQVEVIPEVEYAAGATISGNTSDPHFEYGLGLKATKDSNSKIFSSSNLGVSYSQSTFDSTQGSNTNSHVMITFGVGF